MKKLIFALLISCVPVVEYVSAMEGNGIPILLVGQPSIFNIITTIVDNLRSDHANGLQLIKAVKKGNKERVFQLILAGAELDTREEGDIYNELNNDTALIIAAYYGRIECLKHLIQAGAELDTRGEFGCTALMRAAEGRHPECLKQLIQAGAELNIQDKRGNFTALMKAAACGGGCTECLKHLIQAGAELNRQDKWGNTALMGGALKGNRECVAQLVTQLSQEIIDRIMMGAFVLRKQYELQRSREVALPKDMRKLVVRKLIELFADERMQQTCALLKTKNNNGETAQDCATQRGHLQLALLLDPNNAESQQWIREQIITNIYHALAKKDDTESK